MSAQLWAAAHYHCQLDAPPSLRPIVPPSMVDPQERERYGRTLVDEAIAVGLARDRAGLVPEVSESLRAISTARLTLAGRFLAVANEVVIGYLCVQVSDREGYSIQARDDTVSVRPFDPRQTPAGSVFAQWLPATAPGQGSAMRFTRREWDEICGVSDDVQITVLQSVVPGPQEQARALVRSIMAPDGRRGWTTVDRTTRDQLGRRSTSSVDVIDSRVGRWIRTARDDGGCAFVPGTRETLERLAAPAGASG